MSKEYLDFDAYIQLEFEGFEDSENAAPLVLNERVLGPVDYKLVKDFREMAAAGLGLGPDRPVEVFNPQPIRTGEPVEPDHALVAEFRAMARRGLGLGLDEFTSNPQLDKAVEEVIGARERREA